MEGASLSVVREMQGSEAGAKRIGAVVEAWDSSSEVEVVHLGNQNRKSLFKQIRTILLEIQE